MSSTPEMVMEMKNLNRLLSLYNKQSLQSIRTRSRSFCVKDIGVHQAPIVKRHLIYLDLVRKKVFEKKHTYSYTRSRRHNSGTVRLRS